MAFDYLLPIDSKNTNYQFIHLDLDRCYGIACKFDFTDNNSTFKITHTKVVLTDPDNDQITKFYAYENLSINDNVNHDLFKRQLEVDIDHDPQRNPETTLYNTPECSFDVKSENEEFNRKHIFHVKIKNLETTNIPVRRKFDEEGIVVKFGSHFCKFYIV